MYKQSYGDYLKIERLKVKDSKQELLYKKDFSKFEFISDDKILFMYYSNSARLIFDGIYSIEKNAELKEADWLCSKKVDVYNEEMKNSVLPCEDTIVSSNGNDSLIFTVDCNTFEPNSMCYSSLRDSFIEIKNIEDFEKVKKEDNYYRRIIDYFMFQNYKNSKEEAKEKLLLKK